MIKCILFDADNTLYNSKEAGVYGDRRVIDILAKESNINSETLFSEWKEIVQRLIKETDPSKRRRDCSYKILAERKNLHCDIDNIIKTFREEVLKHLKNKKDITEVLPALRKKYRLGIFTEEERDFLIQKLETTGIRDFFSSFATTDDTKSMKPHIDYYSTLWKRFDVGPNESLVIGDSYEKDLELAKREGAIVVLFEGLHKSADYCIDNYKNLLDILGEI